MSTGRDLNNAEIEPSEYLQKRRHNTINDLRERVYRARARAYDALGDGYSQDLKDDIIRTAVENYVTELEPLLTNTEQGQSYWNEAELGAVTILPPQDGRHYDPPAYEITLTGLEAFQSAPERFAERFEYETSSHARGSQRQVVSVQQAVPESVSWNAFRYANQFAYEIGLDVEHKQEIAVEADPF